ncbi:MAG: HEAT repeat domain-containing protein [Methanobacterium sp.]|nr:HEAT repeat domain-containing protein [Methanobacterium sp.]
MSKGKRIDFLVDELQNKDWVVREDAAELLAEVGDPEAVEPLIKALEDEDWHVKEAAALSLAVRCQSSRAINSSNER